MKNQREFLLSVIVVILIIIFGIKQVIGVGSTWKHAFDEKRTKESTVKDLKLKVDAIDNANKALEKQQDILKPFYKQEGVPADTIASFGNMFDDVVDYIKINGIMLRAIEYNMNPEQDLIFKNFSSNYNVCEVKMSLIGTYPQLQSFFKEIFAYPYYINIGEIDIVPYEANKKYLISQVCIYLYSKK